MAPRRLPYTQTAAPGLGAAAKDGLNAVIAGLSGEDLINYLKKEAISAPYDYDKQFNYAYELHKNKNYPDAIIYYKKAITGAVIGDTVR